MRDSKDLLEIAHNNTQEVAKVAYSPQDSETKRNEYRDNLILLIDILQNENPNAGGGEYRKMWGTLITYILRNN